MSLLRNFPILIMLKLQTPVTFDASKVNISYNDRILVLGSCFAENIGAKLQNAGFDVCVNPFGVLYNPISVCNSFQRMKFGAPFTENDCVEMGAGAGLFCSFSHHTSFADRTPEGFLDKANKALEESNRFMAGCNKVIITLGTAWCYRFEATGETVSNCLKRPAAEFSRYRLDVDSTVAALGSLVKRNGDKQFIFTVSPVRHMKDGAHGNMISKSTLILAVEELCRLYPDQVDYFPSYEIVTDELRDYRFYAEDMVHPSDVAVNYIWERFITFAVPESDRARLADNEKAYRQTQHRQMH